MSWLFLSETRNLWRSCSTTMALLWYNGCTTPGGLNNCSLLNLTQGNLWHHSSYELSMLFALVWCTCILFHFIRNQLKSFMGSFLIEVCMATWNICRKLCQFIDHSFTPKFIVWPINSSLQCACTPLGMLLHQKAKYSWHWRCFKASSISSFWY